MIRRLTGQEIGILIASALTLLFIVFSIVPSSENNESDSLFSEQEMEEMLTIINNEKGKEPSSVQYPREFAVQLSVKNVKE